jgi:preprotein translocase subunit SecF
MEHIIHRRYWWFTLSLLFIAFGFYFLLLHPLVTTGRFQLGLRPSIDFTGGSLWELYFPQQTVDQLSSDEISRIFAESGFDGALVQLSSAELEGRPIGSAIVRTKALNPTDPLGDQQRVLSGLNARYTEVTRERLETVGATLSQEAARNSTVAVIGASLAIMLYLTWAFRQAPNPLRYGVCSVVAMFHDVVLMFGVSAILGFFFSVEIDVLFVTALLTILAFSVHDKIVVFDRIRENLIDRRGGEVFDDIVNRSVVQTLPRSINTQLTPLFTLMALLLFGGDSIRNFVLIMLIGLLSGTYSSIFIAPQLLVMWEHQEWKNWFGRGRRETSAVSAN